MKKEIQKKHKAPKGIFGHSILIILGIFLLLQPWFPEIGLWPIFLVILGIVFIFISHYKQQRKKKKQLSKSYSGNK
jgi:ABC-type transport system involved in cytochrome c biogenesis permease subunit